jgi:cellulose synthase/poly-beta-1,6-N-acetylglucosamine synthase-like glycosyltransferase
MTPKTTIIISVYNDTVALRAIFEALTLQSEKSFAIIVSEDGESQGMAKEVSAARDIFPNIIHLTQPDQGFLKNRALNKAVLASPTEHLIFIDGDCVPHPQFIAGHLAYAKNGVVNCGRRVELGKYFSTRIRLHPVETINILASPWRYLLYAIRLFHDDIKNYELGFYSPWLQSISRKDTSIMGCNFSLQRDDLLAINGFNEEYTSPGFGEDSDIAVRLKKGGCSLLSNKLVTVQYHLHHPRGARGSDENKVLLEKATLSSNARCEKGINLHR